MLPLLLLLLPFLAFGQKVKFSHTGKVNKASREDLQLLAEEFIHSYFTTLKESQLEKSDGSLIIRKALQKLNVEINGIERPVLFGYDLIISLQEGRYSAEVTNTTFTYTTQPVPGERFLGPTPPDDKKDDVEYLSTMSSYQQQTRAFIDYLFKEIDKALKVK